METLELVPTRVRVASIIRKAILTGEYQSGAELSLTGVAEQLGCSRTPVREAFQSLESEGLLTLRMNKGAIVKDIDDKFIRDHFEMRALLESEAAARAAKNGMAVESLLAALKELQPRMDWVSAAEYEALNTQIHRSIWRAADNQKLLCYLQELWNGPSTGHGGQETLEHYQKSTQEHLEILNAIREGDEERAGRVMKNHISRSMMNIEKIMKRLHRQDAK